LTAMRVIFHIDMDAFFASIEQREHPEYRGKPVVVGADPQGGRGRGVVAACSYEARAFGIHSAMPIGRAYRLCPTAVYVRPGGALYAQVSHSVMELLGRFTDMVEPVSIDEAFLDMTGCMRGTSAQELATRIKRVVRHEQHLTCSIGIACNKFLAKIASDLNKPDGLTEVAPGAEMDFLTGLPVGKLWGVGPKTGERLAALGIRTVGDVRQRPLPFWSGHLGKLGQHLWNLSHGIDGRPVVPESAPKSFSREHTFGADTDTLEDLKATLLELAEDVARRARHHGVRARTVSLKFRFADFTTFDRQKTLAASTAEGPAIYGVVCELLQSFFPLAQKVRLLGVGISHFSPGVQNQPGLFDAPELRRRSLGASLDRIVERFGADSIRRARLLNREKTDQVGLSSFLKK
jgi:DNA polymerase-4